MRKLKIVTQTDNIEGKSTPKDFSDDWMDDCAWATLACAANHLTGSTFTSFDAVKWGEKVGRHDVDGKGTPSTLAQTVKAGPLAGLKVTYAREWVGVVNALKDGAVVMINVEQPRGYPNIFMSEWHKKHQKRNPGKTYGHMTCAAMVDGVLQWADPTMSGKGKEEFAVPLSFEELKAIASSKGDAPHKRCLIAVRRTAVKEPVEAPRKPVESPKVAAPTKEPAKPAGGVGTKKVL